MAQITTSFIDSMVPNLPGNDFAVLVVGTLPIDDLKGKSKVLQQCLTAADYNTHYGNSVSYWDDEKGVEATRANDYTVPVFAEAYLAKAKNLYIYNVLDPDTHKEDVATGSISFYDVEGDAGSAISSVVLEGVDHVGTQDATLYWSKTYDSSAGVHNFSLYSDSAKTALVAQGTAASTTITLAEENSSGISGVIELASSAGATDADSANKLIIKLSASLPDSMLVDGSVEIFTAGGAVEITAGFTIDYAAGKITRASTIAAADYDVDYSYLDPSAVTPAQVGAAIDLAKEQIYAKYGKKYNKVHAPVFNTETVVREALKNASFYNGCFYASSVYDIDPDNTTWTADQTAASLLDDKNYTDYTMDVGFNDDTETELKMSDFIILQYAVNAKNRAGIPSQPISGNAIDGYDPEFGSDYNLNYTKCNSIAEQGITTACRLGASWVLWGDNRTADTSTSVYYKRYQTARDMRFYIANFLVEETFKKLQKNNITLAVLRNIIETGNGLASKLVSSEDMAGMKVYILPEENPVANIANGKIKFRIKDMSYPALLEAEFVFETDLSYLESVLPGN